MIDSVLVPMGIFAAVGVGDSTGIFQHYGKLILIIGPILFLEPFLIAFSGGTVGHHLMGIRVTKLDGSGNINVFAASIRLVLKLALGWLSFIFVLTTTKHQAVHDLLVKSIVVLKDPSSVPTYQVQYERKADDQFLYPSALRRAIVIVCFCLMASILVVAITMVASSSGCIERGHCNTLDVAISMAANILWIVALGWIIVKGWNGELYGCRKRHREPTK